mgnify:CR=1 FL=1
MIARLICRLFGHKRGVRVSETLDGQGSKSADFRCPRCNAMWSRKVYARKGVTA